MQPQKHVEGLVDQPIDVVWRLITSPRKYHGIKIPHIYGPFATPSGQPHVGATFLLRGLAGGTTTMYVVDCDPPREFSFGCSCCATEIRIASTFCGLGNPMEHFIRRIVVDSFFPRPPRHFTHPLFVQTETLPKSGEELAVLRGHQDRLCPKDRPAPAGTRRANGSSDRGVRTKRSLITLANILQFDQVASCCTLRSVRLLHTFSD